MFLDLWELAMKGRITAWQPSAGSGGGQDGEGQFCEPINREATQLGEIVPKIA
jgi:hypothetical protein